MELNLKREAKHEAARLSEYGVYLCEPYDEHVRGRAFLTLIRGILVFLATYGTIGGLTAAFGLGFNPIMIGLGLLVISVTIAFTYYNKVTFYTGYILLFMAFLVMYVIAYIYINSGFQAFLNQIYAAYSDFFILPSTRETTEYIADRSITVPAAMLFTGAGLAILLNISISAYMDLFSTFLVTFLPMQLAFYIDIIPPLPYLIMLIAVYITVAILGRSGRFRLPYRYRRGQQFSHRTGRHGEKHEYLASGIGMIQLSIIGVTISAALMLIMNGMFGGGFTTRFVSNKVKDTTDRYVAALAQGGVAALFNRYQATGGISYGRLGGIASVTPDYETDIVVRMVPVSTESKGRMSRLYLKAYTGAWYEDNRFSDILRTENGETMGSIPADDYIPVGANYMDTDETAYMKLWLMNKDADNVYDYRPYYTLYSGSGRGEKATGIARNVSDYASDRLRAEEYVRKDRDLLTEWVDKHSEEGENNTFYELIYTPYAESGYYEPNPSVSEEYEAYVYANYLGISDDLKATVREAAAAAGLDRISVSPSDITLTGIDGEYRGYIASQQERLKMAQALKQYYVDEYSYSMLPGTTPMGRDTVEYFISELKRGYCVHFAASAALILRSMGIPTRYIEGYVIDPTDIIEGDASTAPAGEWVLSVNGAEAAGAAEAEVAVADVEIPDANAHAWIEIYIDGYGWIPYEMTPPSDDEDIQYGSIAEFFAGIFSRTVRGDNGDDNGVINTDGGVGSGNSSLLNNGFTRVLGSMDFLLRPLIIISCVIIALISAVYIARSAYDRYRLLSAIHRGDYSYAVLWHYGHLLKYIRKRGLVLSPHPPVNEVTAVLTDITDAPEDDKDRLTEMEIKALRDIVNAAAFGSSGTDERDLDSALDIMKHVKIILKAI